MTYVHPTTALLTLSAVLLVTVCKLLYNKFHSSHLLQIPGPRSAAYTGYWRALEVSRGHAETTLVALHAKYGPLVRTAPRVVSVADPDEITKIFGQSHTFLKSGFYPLQSITWKKEPAFNLFSTRSDVEHRKLSRQVGSAYSMASILQSEPALDSCLDIFVDQLRARSGQALDLGIWLQYLTFDAMGEITFAKKFGFLEQGSDIDGIIESIGAQAGYSAVIGQVPDWHGWLLGNPLLSKMMKPLEDWNATLRFCVKAMHARTQIRDGQIVAADESDGVDMVSKWSRVKPSDPHKMNERDLMVALTANIFAGSETIAIACKSIIYHLCRNRDVLVKATAEILAADQAGLLSRRITHKEATTYLPYMAAAIKEGQRLHPSFGLPFERVVPAAGATVAGRFLPAGTVVGISPWVLNADAALFPQPARFVPERWLDDGGVPDALRRREHVLAFNFGHGARACAGRNVAHVEMLKIVPELLRRFDVALARPEQKWTTRNVWFVQQSGLDVVLTPR